MSQLIGLRYSPLLNQKKLVENSNSIQSYHTMNLVLKGEALDLVRNPSVPVYMYISSWIIFLRCFEIVHPTPTINSDFEGKSNFKSGTSSDKIIYKAKGPNVFSIDQTIGYNKRFIV